MSEEQLKAFLEKVKSDTSLQEKLKGSADVDAALAIAKEAGYTICAGDVRTSLSNDELEGVAGGIPGVATTPQLTHVLSNLTSQNPDFFNGFDFFSSLTNPIDKPPIPGTIERINYLLKTLQDIVAITVKDSQYPYQKSTSTLSCFAIDGRQQLTSRKSC
ncbi:Nitrogen fixation protein of unknown function [Synechococcus sp. MIT S9509]|nr:Nitrogen fixation protein of unknown function [Synechococcus sp. MIT S9504]KZR92284.1 Nitrogen fixation protein of unknown function [Synechococcus sp. MIT S9509]